MPEQRDPPETTSDDDDKISYTGVRESDTKQFASHDRADDDDTEDVEITRSKPS